MELVGTGDSRVVKIATGGALDPARRYRLSGYVYLWSSGDVLLAFNTLTRQAVRIDERERDALLHLRERTEDASFVEQFGLDELARLRFIVDEAYDETAQYTMTIGVLKALNPPQRGTGCYTVLPTTACNARCTYCYEEGIALSTMTRETADRLVDFICETKREGSIRLVWFGGEPLIGADTISRICRALRERGVEFSSEFTTNGTLLDEELLAEALDVWNLVRVQVSMDGERRDYEERKRYVNPRAHNYDTAMRGVELLANAGVRVTLRVNYDRGNLAGLRGFFEEVAERFGESDMVTVYTEMLFGSEEGEACAQLLRDADRVTRHLDELGIRLPGSYARARLSTNYCKADAGESSVIIDPDGGLYYCQNLMGNAPWGTIFDGVTDQARFDEVCTPVPIADECRGCCWLPDCTPYYKSGCPDCISACREYRRLRVDRMLEGLLAGLSGDDEPEEVEC